MSLPSYQAAPPREIEPIRPAQRRQLFCAGKLGFRGMPCRPLQRPFPNDLSRWQAGSMKTQPARKAPSAWNGPTLIELQSEGRLLSAREARSRWEQQQKKEAAAERRWLTNRPWVGPVVWAGGNFRKFLALADDSSIHRALGGMHAPISALQRQLARTELRNRRDVRRCGEGHPQRCKVHGF